MCWLFSLSILAVTAPLQHSFTPLLLFPTCSSVSCVTHISLWLSWHFSSHISFTSASSACPPFLLLLLFLVLLLPPFSDSALRGCPLTLTLSASLYPPSPVLIQIWLHLYKRKRQSKPCSLWSHPLFWIWIWFWLPSDFDFYFPPLYFLFVWFISPQSLD